MWSCLQIAQPNIKLSAAIPSGCSSDSLVANVGWTYDSRDNILFPTRGVLQRLTGDVTVSWLRSSIL